MSAKSTKAEPIDTDGASLSVRLYHLNDMTMSAPELVKFMKANKFTALSETKEIKVRNKQKEWETREVEIATQGFTQVQESGKTISATFFVSFPQSIYAFDRGRLIVVETSFAAKSGEVIFKLGRKFVEVRGSDRIGSRLRTFLRREDVARIAPVAVSGDSAKNVFNELKRLPNANITYTLFTDIQSVALTRAEFRGERIQNASEINLYPVRYKGNIAKFSGIIPYPSSKKLLKTSVNFASGSLNISPKDMTEETTISPKAATRTRKEEKDKKPTLSPKDLRWLVTMLEDNADPYPPPEK